MRVPRELRGVVKACVEQGWKVLPTKGRGNTHLRFLSPDPNVKPIYFSSSPSDHRSFANLYAELRRAGLELDKK